MKPNGLIGKLEQLAKQFDVKVEYEYKGVCLVTAEGYQFDTELHGLVSSQWDNEPMPNVYRRAIKDLKENGPRIRPCPIDCPCKD